MSEIPDVVIKRLSNSCYKRKDTSDVDRALRELSVGVPPIFSEFYRRFEGPIGSITSGFTLLELCGDEESVVNSTAICRKQYRWPDRFLVVTEYLCNSVCVLDTADGRVYNVDFEGSDELLLQGQLEPEWDSFGAFLADLFGPSERG